MREKLLIEGNIVKASTSKKEFSDFVLKKVGEVLERLKVSGVTVN